MEGYRITKDKVETVLDKKFIRVYDLHYEDGAHYFDASRRPLDELVAAKTEGEFKKMLPDAVSCFVIIDNGDGHEKLLLSYEYRYPTGRFVLGVPAGLMDPEDRETEQPLLETARREMFEECGIEIDYSKDRLYVVNPLVFSTPGMTDESNGLVCVVLKNPDLSKLNQKGALGQEFFDGFVFADKDKARDLLKKGADDNGHFYSVYTWAALMYFVSDMWK